LDLKMEITRLSQSPGFSLLNYHAKGDLKED